ncbi:hypothetical protein Tco_0878282 [Tanacetum coccineum]|uniref:Ubiquinone biosynthesis protein n=1 Tax=Tanacetum coccineum TaxID=301880 RepID=A0ABQ5C064_9ASTR
MRLYRALARYMPHSIASTSTLRLPPTHPSPPIERAAILTLAQSLSPDQADASTPSETTLGFCRGLGMVLGYLGDPADGSLKIVEAGCAYASQRGLWAYAIGLSQAVHSELQTHREHVYARVSAPCSSDTSTVTLYSSSDTAPGSERRDFPSHVIRDMRREMVDKQAELLALREQRRKARQLGSDARAPDN